VGEVVRARLAVESGWSC